MYHCLSPRSILVTRKYALNGDCTRGPEPIDARLDGYGVGVVLRSECKGVKQGDYIYGLFRTSLPPSPRASLDKDSEHQQYTIYPDLSNVGVIDNKYGLSLSTFLGPAGLPGIHLWFFVAASAEYVVRQDCIYGLEEACKCTESKSLVLVYRIARLNI